MRRLGLTVLLVACGPPEEPWVPRASNPGVCPSSYDTVCRSRSADVSWCTPGLTCVWERALAKQTGIFSCDGNCKTYSLR
ncbi:MAG: hypothetical protein Q8L48_29325 [Archangium sp.]|nr:hypothetical protein [Archangium sp.]